MKTASQLEATIPPVTGARGTAAEPALRDKVRSLRLEDSTNRQPPRRIWPAWCLVLLFACSTAYFALRPLPTANPSSDQLESESLSADSSSTSTTENTSTESVAVQGDVVLEAKGYVIPAHQILISPKVNGMIVRFFIEEGQRVKQGEVLAELETIDYQADVNRAKATLAVTEQKLLELERGNRPEEIAQAKAELNEAEAQRVQLLSAYERSRRLRESNTISPSDYEQAESSYKAMDRRVQRLKAAYDLMVKGPRQERIDLARAEVQQARADLVKADWRLSNCTIHAPLTGTILKKNAEEGNIVNPIAFNGSFSICEMADLSDLEVELSIQERDISRVFKGQKCEIRSEAYPERNYFGHVSRLMPIADRAKGAIPVRVKVQVPAAEEGVYLKPEMGVVVSFRKESISTGDAAAASSEVTQPVEETPPNSGPVPATGSSKTKTPRNTEPPPSSERSQDQ